MDNETEYQRNGSEENTEILLEVEDMVMKKNRMWSETSARTDNN